MQYLKNEGVLDKVNQRTQLVGQNRLELLLFKLNETQRFGINVFKVKEVIQCTKLTQVPKAHPHVRGVTNIRGDTITIIDLSKALGGEEIGDHEQSYIIITEYNNSIQGFLVNAVDKIVNMHWEAITAPPSGVNSAENGYLTAVTEVEDELVLIVDVEKVLLEICPQEMIVSEELKEHHHSKTLEGSTILVVDDSSVARKQVSLSLEQMGVNVIVRHNGREAIDLLRQWQNEGINPCEKLLMIISDVEMPEMDGYTLCSEIKNDIQLKELYVVLHTSLSGVFNKTLIEKVGADKFIGKFKADALVQVCYECLDIQIAKQKQ